MSYVDIEIFFINKCISLLTRDGIWGGGWGQGRGGWCKIYLISADKQDIA